MKNASAVNSPPDSPIHIGIVVVVAFIVTIVLAVLASVTGGGHGAAG